MIINARLLGWSVGPIHDGRRGAGKKKGEFDESVDLPSKRYVLQNPNQMDRFEKVFQEKTNARKRDCMQSRLF